MNRNEIYARITAERDRQNRNHPVAFAKLLDAEGDPDTVTFRNISLFLKGRNDRKESENDHSAYGISLEELYEFFAETELERQVEEAIQNATWWVRMVEELTK